MTTVGQYANNSAMGGCSTVGVKGLSDQIFQLLQSGPNPLASCAGFVNLGSGSTIPFLQKAACDAFEAAVQQKGQTPTLLHAYRAVPQQYVLYHWYRNGKCSIPLAARPGTSPHERAIAIDISNNASWRAVLAQHNWRWRGPADPGHFTYIGSGLSADVGRESIRAFQRLWNTNNPTDRIDEDGVYGEQETGPRLRSSPAGGW